MSVANGTKKGLLARAAWQPAPRASFRDASLRAWVWMLTFALLTATAFRSHAGAGVVEFTGKVECEPAVLAEGETATACRFTTERGEVYILVSNRLSEALFADTNLHGRTLVVYGRVDPAARTFEVTGNLRSRIAGRLHELFYYCDVCTIKGIQFGPCLCCREPVELVEEPIGDTSTGKIAGRVLFRGMVPRADVADDAGAHRALLDVDGKSGGLGNAVAYLGSTPALRAASLVSAPTNAALIDQLGHTFVPRVLAIRSGREVRFINSDAANHNVHTSSSTPANEFNVFTGTDGGGYTHRFISNSNATAVRLGCDIHPWMRGWIFVFDHDFFATTSGDGSFQIDAVPAGEHTLVLRQPDTGYETRRVVRVSAGGPTRIEFEVTDADLKRR